MKYLIPNAPLPNDLLSQSTQVKPLVNEICRIDKNAKITFLSLNFPYFNYLISLLIHYFKTDLIIFTGGNYLRDEKGFGGLLRYLIILTTLYLTKITNKKTLIMPITFGPFKRKLLKSLTVNSLKSFNSVMARDNNSFDELVKSGLKNAVNSYDVSLLIKKVPQVLKPDGVAIITSNWSSGAYSLIDRQVAKALGVFCKKYALPLTPVIVLNESRGNLNSKEYRSYVRMIRILKRYRIRLNKLEYAPDSETLITIYAKHQMVIGMRLHPVLIAITQEIPFIAINRNQKSMAILKSLGLNNYYMQAHTLNLNTLNAKMEVVYKRRNDVRKTLAIKNIEVKKTIRKQLSLNISFARKISHV